MNWVPFSLLIIILSNQEVVSRVANTVNHPVSPLKLTDYGKVLCM